MVSRAELSQVLARAGAHRMTDTQVRQMVETADSDGNEVLDYAEFEQLWNQIRADTEVSPEWLPGGDGDDISTRPFHRMKRKSDRNFSS